MILCRAVLRSSIVQWCVDCDDSKKDFTYIADTWLFSSRQSALFSIEQGVELPLEVCPVSTHVSSTLELVTSPGGHW